MEPQITATAPARPAWRSVERHPPPTDQDAARAILSDQVGVAQLMRPRTQGAIAPGFTAHPQNPGPRSARLHDHRLVAVNSATVPSRR